MCCCNFQAIGLAIANFMYNSQKLASCFALTAIVSTLVVTLLTMLGVGIGLGYHYCIVESKTYKLDLQEFKAKYKNYRHRAMEDENTNSFTDDTTTEAMESQNFRRVNNPDNTRKPSMDVPVDIDTMDLSSIISKIKGENKNFTLNFVVK